MTKIFSAYYGWRIVGTLAITETISWGILHYAFSVFIVPMEAEFGWSRAEVIGAFSLSLLISGVMSIPAGFWIDRHGARTLMTIGSIVASFLVFAWSGVNNLTIFYLIWAAIGVTRAAVLYEPAFVVVANWFERDRSKALAIITFAAGLASTIFVPLTDWLYQTQGWRGAVFSLGILLAVSTIPLHAIILRRRPSDLGLLVDGVPEKRKLETQEPMSTSVTYQVAVRQSTFWWLTASFALAGFAATGLRVNFLPFLTDNGWSSSAAAYASGSIGIMQVVGRLIFAPLEPRISIRMLSIIIFALQALAIILLVLTPTIGTIIAFVICFGSAYGAMTLARPSILAVFYGSEHYGKISSIMNVFMTASLTAGPLVVGIFFEQFGRYTEVWFGLMVVFVLAILAIAFIRQPQTIPELA